MSKNKREHLFTSDLIDNLYIKSNLRASDIAKMYGASVHTVTKYIKKHGIKIKGIRHYNIHERMLFTTEQYQFFDGLIISDGSLCVDKSGGRNRNAYISCAFKHKEFADYIINYLDLQCDCRKKIHVNDRYKNGKCEQYAFVSRNNVLFTDEKQRWYPYGNKIIPNDFRFSNISMNIMYLCDGYLKKGKTYRSVRLCTQSFSKKNINEIIIKELNSVNIDAHVSPDNQVLFNTKNSIDFLEYIGNCPVKCYEYKWDV